MDEHVTLVAVSPPADELAGKVRMALDRAMVKDGKLAEELLHLEGMSGQKYRYFINNLIESLTDPSYLEIGSHFGSTLCAAIFGNTVTATAIDNWSYNGEFANKFLANLARLKPATAKVSFLDSDFRQVDYHGIGLYNVYLFDGPHREEDQYDGIVLAQPALAESFVLVVDDWNWPEVQQGTMRAIRDLRLHIDFSVEIRTSLDGIHPQVAFQDSDWHNGYFIAALRKPHK